MITSSFASSGSFFSLAVLSIVLPGCNEGGVADPAFDFLKSGFDDDVEVIAPATDGSGDIYVGGEFTTYDEEGSNSIIRLNADGTVDAGFVVHAGFNDEVAAITPATDGSGDIYVGGSFGTYDGKDSNHIIRLNADGTVDAGFVVGTGFSDYVGVITPATDGSGDIYVGGGFTGYNVKDSSKIIRLNADGTVDAGFVVGTGFSKGSVRAIAPVADDSGDIYVGGSFTTYNKTRVDRAAALNPDGSLERSLD